MCRLGKRRDPRRGIVLLIALWCGVGAGCQPRQTPNPHAYIPYARPSEVDLEPAPEMGNSRYRQPHIADRYPYDGTEVDLDTPLP